MPAAAHAEDKVRYEAELKEHKAKMEKKNAEKLEKEVSDACDRAVAHVRQLRRYHRAGAVLACRPRQRRKKLRQPGKRS